MWVSHSLLLQGAHQQACVSRSDIAGGGVFISNTCVGRTYTMGKGVHERKSAKTFLVPGCSPVSVSGPLLVFTRQREWSIAGGGVFISQLVPSSDIAGGWLGGHQPTCAQFGHCINVKHGCCLGMMYQMLLSLPHLPDVTIASTLSLQLF